MGWITGKEIPALIGQTKKGRESGAEASKEPEANCGKGGYIQKYCEIVRLRMALNYVRRN